MKPVGLMVAGLIAAAIAAPAQATTLVIDPTVEAQRSCNIAFGACATYAQGFLLLGGVQQGLISTGGLEYALPTLPPNTVLTSARLSIGAYSRADGHPGWQDNAIGTINFTSYVGNGLFDAGDVDHRGAIDVTLARAATSQYDVSRLVSTFQAAGDGFIGFSIYQSPVGVCGYGSRCEVLLTGDTQEFAFTNQPQLIVDYETAAPPITPLPEPTTWAMMLGGFGLVGAAMRRRHRHRAIA